MLEGQGCLLTKNLILQNHDGWKLSGEGPDRVFIQHSLKIYQFTVLTRDFVSKEGGVDARGAEFAVRLFKSLQVLSNAALSMAAMAIK